MIELYDVPPDLWTLADLVEQWGIGDDILRDDAVHNAATGAELSVGRCRGDLQRCGLTLWHLADLADARRELVGRPEPRGTPIPGALAPTRPAQPPPERGR
jgi:hypothetical protein